jgi:hypothetical protein
MHLALQEHRARDRSYEEGGVLQSFRELSDLGLSPRYLSDVWKKHKEDILDPLNKDLYVSVKQLKGSGRHRPFSQEFKDPFLHDGDSINDHPLCIEVGASKAEYSTVGWDIYFVTQPANSPDLNTLDLAFFRAIQSLQYQKPAKNLDKMIEIVHKVCADLPLDVCKNVWTTAQLVMNQVLLCNGGNNYKLPHVGKLKISAAANGRDMMQLLCCALIARDHLNADAITAAIVANDQGMPARLFLIVVSFPRHLLLPLIPPYINRACHRGPLIMCAAAVHRLCVPLTSITISPLLN